MKTKYDIINFLGKKYNYSTYLEISSVATGYDYDKIDNEIFKIKDILLYYPIDDFTYDWKNINVRNDINFGPDEFEKGLNKLEGKKYDIIFVDPWHTFEQSKRDISVAINLVSDNGIIVIHDCSPEHFSLTGQYSMGGWCGQTYEAFI